MNTPDEYATRLADALRIALPRVHPHLISAADKRQIQLTLASFDARGRVCADPSTIAYVAIGAHDAIKECPRGVIPESVAVQHDGELGFIEAVIKHALLLDRMADAKNNELSCVFCYEIAEEFGHAYAKALINANGTTPSAEDIARDTFIAAGENVA